MKRFVTVSLVLLAGVVAVAAAMPGMTTCLMLEHSGLERLPDGTLVDPSLTAAERAEIQALREQGAGRVSAFLGDTAARPLVAFLAAGDPPRPWLRSNPVASTHFVATRACVVIVGPK